MIEFGETLRNKRVEKGLTISDIANTTHMLVQQVEALEKEDFSKIAAPIYGRGFVKLYCEAVGIEDPKPFIDEFMDIFLGNKPPTIRMRETPSSSGAIKNLSATPQIESNSEGSLINLEKNNSQEDVLLNQNDDSNAITTDKTPPSEPRDLFEFTLEHETATLNNTKLGLQSPINPVNDTDSSQPIQETLYLKSHGPSRYATPQPIEYCEKKLFAIPPVVLRFSILALGAALLIWLIFSSISCLYNASIPTKTQNLTETDTARSLSLSKPTNNNTDKTDVKARQKRKTMQLPPLYID